MKIILWKILTITSAYFYHFHYFFLPFSFLTGKECTTSQSSVEKRKKKEGKGQLMKKYNEITNGKARQQNDIRL